MIPEITEKSSILSWRLGDRDRGSLRYKLLRGFDFEREFGYEKANRRMGAVLAHK